MTTEQIAALTREDFHRMAGELKPETRMFIDGRFVNANSSRQFKTINPANDEVIASMPLGGPEDVDLAVAAARKAFKSGVWSRMESRARASVVYRAAGPRLLEAAPGSGQGQMSRDATHGKSDQIGLD